MFQSSLKKTTDSSLSEESGRVVSVLNDLLLKFLYSKGNIAANRLELLVNTLLELNYQPLEVKSKVAHELFTRLGEKIPAFGELVDTPQTSPYHREGTVAVHTLLVLINILQHFNELSSLLEREIPGIWNKKFLTISILVAMFHDISKTGQLNLRPDRFFAHAVEGAETSEKLLEELSWPKDIIKRVIYGIRNHSYYHFLFILRALEEIENGNTLQEIISADYLKDVEEIKRIYRELVDKNAPYFNPELIHELQMPDPKKKIAALLLCLADAKGSLRENADGKLEPFPYPSWKFLRKQLKN